MKNIFFSIILFYFNQNVSAQFTQFVNPFIGTGGHGHTYPGATTPFGMVQLSPDTRNNGYTDWDGCSGYHYSDSIIYGFSHTHLSGTGVADYCDILLMPIITNNVLESFKNKSTFKNGGYPSKFSHANEKATPGFYSVFLDDDKIQVDLTTSERVGMHRYKFPKTDKANIIIDLTHRDQLLDSSYIKIISDRKIEGLRRSSSWAKDQWIYFAIEFSEPFDKYITPDGIKNFEYGFHFNLSNSNTVLVKCALSPVSCSGAWKNMVKEIPDWEFENVQLQAQEKWNKQLSKIEVSGGALEDKIVFYTALYHSMIAPNIYFDVDGNYRGRDLQIHNTNFLYDYYTVFSLWDTYRAVHPLYTILEQKRTLDFIQTFLTQYDQGSKLPVWELSSNETECMIGYHSVSVITDAYKKNITDFDVNKAYEAMRNTSMLNERGLLEHKYKGLIESGDESESVSKLLEYCYDDWCIAEFGVAIKSEGYNNYYLRSKNWMNLFDGEFIRPRNNGGWYQPFDPTEVNINYTEANAWQYNFAPVHDLGSLFPINEQSENEKRIDQLFTSSSKMTGRNQSDISGMIGQYAHGNEPSHHLAYLYNYVGATEKTQFYINKIRTDFYKNTPDGLIGNEDCGQMSAWYIFSAMGFYPICPGAPEYTIGTPLFDTIKIHLENGKTTTIVADNKKSNNSIFVESITVNDKKIFDAQISHQQIMDGSTIVFQMSDQNTNTIAGSIPKSIADYVPRSPIIETKTVFQDSTLVTIISYDSTETIYYNLKGINPLVTNFVYTKPFMIYQSSTIVATAKSNSGNAGRPITSIVKKIPKNFSIQYLTKFDSQYNGGSEFALMDGLRADEDFRTGGWQGWWGSNMELLVDLGKIKNITTVRAGFLQDINSWIWLPQKVSIYASQDGINFNEVVNIPNTIQSDSIGSILKDYTVGFNGYETRYIKIVAHNIAVIPNWHVGKGDKAWIFCDEVVVE